MKYILFLILSLVVFANTIQAEQSIKLYVDPRPPLGYTTKEWHNAVMNAAAQWFVAAGKSTRSVKSPVTADIVVQTYQMEHWLGVAFRPKWIYIKVSLPSDCSLEGLLLHEFGHIAGLEHRSGSIMETGYRPRLGLTLRDRQYIRDVLSHTIGIPLPKQQNYFDSKNDF